MHAMVLKALGAPLEWTELPDRLPGPGEIRVTLAAPTSMSSMANCRIQCCRSFQAT
jgi:hypothetical protein